MRSLADVLRVAANRLVGCAVAPPYGAAVDSREAAGMRLRACFCEMTLLHGFGRAAGLQIDPRARASGQNPI